MISIKDTVGRLWVPCPKCQFGVIVEHWGEQTCRYEKCDGHKFMVEYNLDTATLIFKAIEANTKRVNSISLEPMKRPSMPRLQRILDGWIAVPQLDTEDPREWYHADQVMFADYMKKYLATKSVNKNLENKVAV